MIEVDRTAMRGGGGGVFGGVFGWWGGGFFLFVIWGGGGGVLTRTQQVPAQQIRRRADLSRQLGARNQRIRGADARSVRGSQKRNRKSIIDRKHKLRRFRLRYNDCRGVLRIPSSALLAAAHSGVRSDKLEKLQCPHQHKAADPDDQEQVSRMPNRGDHEVQPAGGPAVRAGDSVSDWI